MIPKTQRSNDMIASPSLKQLLLAFVFVVLSAPVYAAGNGIAGLWEIEGTPDGAPGPAFTNLVSISKEGSLTNIDPWFGTGLGQWQKQGGNLYSISFTHYFLDGESVGEVKVTATAQLSADRQEFHGIFLTEISIGGVPVDSFEGTVVAVRQ
jgi:hypothetical protein